MIPEIGYAALVTALALSAYGAFVAARGARSAREGWLRSARRAAIAQFVLVTGAAAALEYLLVTSDFSVRYVATHSI